VRVTQTFRQLNIRRLIEIIGYDPSQYFKGEMSYENLNNLKRGQIKSNNQVGRRSDLSGAFGRSSSPNRIPRTEDHSQRQYRQNSLGQNLA
jgi:hypothetical protein